VIDELIGHHWHHLPGDEVCELLETHPERGLGELAVKHRQTSIGYNRLTARKGPGALRRLLAQLNQPLIYILIVAGAVTAVLQEWVDAGVIFGVVVINAGIGYVQESKAVKALEALAGSMTTQALVVRDGRRHTVDAEQLVPGDLVVLQTGDKVPADVRLLSERDLHADESALTGESLPVGKSVGTLQRQTTLADRTNMVYASTLVTRGAGTGVVVATGDATEVGRISGLLASAQDISTPLTRKIAHFSHLLLYVIIGLGVMTFVVGVVRGETVFEMFLAAVALAVGAIPEGLPAVVTITLAIGVNRMAGRRAIVRKLPAVETLGSTTVICSDKTGTLTENQMTVQAVEAGGVSYAVSGRGYEPIGSIVAAEDGGAAYGEEAADELPVALRRCLTAGVLCSDAELRREGERWAVQGDPTEGALIVSAAQVGLDRARLLDSYERLDTIPFESERQFMATLHRDIASGERLIHVKGAAEVVLRLCSGQSSSSGRHEPLSGEQVMARVDEMAAQGLRVLAFAAGPDPGQDALRRDHLDGLTFLGLQGMIDPPRPEAIAAVAACHRAGVKTTMITGDHVGTARAIAQKMGLGYRGPGGDVETRALSGHDLESSCDEDLLGCVNEVSVFARVTPEQKLRLVEALQARGEVVAMTGDGVNDAPALRQADIGVAMGVGGTEVAKEAADMVLTDDNFASIEAAVEEGRGVFDNLVKFITWTLPTNLGEGLVILAAVLAGVSLPVLPVQILWINMTTAVFLGLMLAFEPKESDVMERPPRPPAAPLLTRALGFRVLMVGLLLLLAAFGLFEWAVRSGYDIDVARTLAVNVFVCVEAFYLFACRSLTRPLLRLRPFSNRWLLVGVALMAALQVLYTYAPPLNVAFGSAPLTPALWGLVLAVGAGVLIIVEIEKWAAAALVRRRDRSGTR
jgi:Ca2+-transporting ATPase